MADRTGYRAALGHPVVRGLWLATVVSSMGDFLATGALSVTVYARTESIFGAAGVFAIAGLPALLSGALTGSFLDRAPRGTTLAGLQLAGAVAVGLPIAVGGTWPLFLAAGLLGAVRAANVSIRSAAMAESVPDEHRGPLLALMGTTEQASQVVGYLVGTSLAAGFGIAPALLADAASFVVGGIILSSLPLSRPAPRDRRPPLTAGLRDIASNPILRLLAPLVLVTAVVGALPESMAAAISGPDIDRLWVPLAFAAAPAGQAITMLVMGRLRHVGRPTVQLTQLAWLALAFGIAALGRSAPWFALANFLVGSGMAWTMGPQLTFIRVAPNERMAQITGTMIALIVTVEGVGASLFGLLADLTDISTVYRVAGVLVLVSAVVGWVAVQRTPSAIELDEQLLTPESS